MKYENDYIMNQKELLNNKYLLVNESKIITAWIVI